MSPTAETTRSAPSRARALAAALLCACAGPEPADLEAAEASLAIAAVPSDAACLLLTVVGATRRVERQFDLTPGAAALLSVDALPVGETLFLASAYASGCSAVTSTSVRSWYGIPVRAMLTPGVPVSITVALHR
jgi:hypothetical protein